MAGLEERLSKLETILHRLFCCDTNQFTGPQGPQGPIGEEGPQGPAGVNGEIIFQNLNWTGAFTPCVIYNQYDAVSYEGSSYFLNCESSATFECESPVDNPSCWILLANQGAPGVQGQQGIAGNDGSNSGRWNWHSASLTSSDPGSTWFKTNTANLNNLSRIDVSYEDINATDYKAWWAALHSFGVDYPSSLFFIQITEVGSNNIIGIYKVLYKVPTLDTTLFLNYISIGLDPVYVSSFALNANKKYTISWSIHGGINSETAPKTKGNVVATLSPAPFPVLEYDFNYASSENPWIINDFPAPSFLYYVALPTPTKIGQELIIITQGEYEFGIVTYNGLSTMLVNTVPQLLNEFVVWPGDHFRAIWSGDFWIIEHLQGSTPKFNLRRTVLNKYEIGESDYDTVTIVYPTLAGLNSNYPSSLYAVGLKVYMPNIPGGPRCFVKVSDTEWESFSTSTVI